MRHIFFLISFFVFAVIAGLSYLWFPAIYLLVVVLPLFALGVHDAFQTQHTIKRNFPVIGHFRYLLEDIRPEIQQYFIENDQDGTPFSRVRRSVVYQRAKKVRDTIGFGSQLEFYRVGHEWINHSINPKSPPAEEPRIRIGGKDCSQPYDASIFNISAMSFGALSRNAILALNQGAQAGGFFHNTGEGAISSYHRKAGGDLCWQVGTGYFGCRTPQGRFDAEKFREKASLEEVKLIELKLSQGAKPGHGGILPAAKLTPEICEIRGVEMGKDVISPPSHQEFSTPIGLLEFIGKLRELSGGKPVGFKLCMGRRRDFMAICKAMIQTGIKPDFIAIDGAEGGTGAAPLEFANYIGAPLDDSLIFAHNALTGAGVREDIKLIASGKVNTGFHIAQKLALGADLTVAARAFMFALGCIQALRCNANVCPTGIATQDKGLEKGLVVADKWKRVRNYHQATVHSFLEVIAAAGIDHPDHLRPWHIQRRVSDSVVKHYGAIYQYLKPKQLVEGDIPQQYQLAWKNSCAESFDSPNGMK